MKYDSILFIIFINNSSSSTFNFFLNIYSPSSASAKRDSMEYNDNKL